MLPAEAEDRDPFGTATAQRLEDPLGQGQDVLAGPHVFDQDGELVSAETRRSVERPEAGGEVGRHPLQQLVSHPVSQAVVHRLEVVEVDEDHGEVGTGLTDSGQGMLEPVLEQRLVRQSGQGIVEGPVFQLVLQPDAVGDVAEAPDSTDDGAVRPSAASTTVRRRARP